MKIALKLLASFADYLPAEAKYTNLVELDLAPDIAIGQLVGNTASPKNWCIWCWLRALILRQKNARCNPLWQGVCWPSAHRLSMTNVLYKNCPLAHV